MSCDLSPNNAGLSSPGEEARMKQRLQEAMVDSIADARAKWLEASAKASALAAELLQPGGGYGVPEARPNDKHRLQTARLNAEWLHREYSDLEHRHLDSKMVKLQQSQRLATWSSFAVASAIGITTIVKSIVDLLKKSLRRGSVSVAEPAVAADGG